MKTKIQVIIELETIEHAAHLGYIRNPLAELTARLLRLEMVNSETEQDARERAIEFIDSFAKA